MTTSVVRVAVTRESSSPPVRPSLHQSNPLLLFSNSQVGGYSSQVGGGAQLGTSEYDQNRAQLSQHGQSGFGSSLENSIQSAMGGNSSGGGGSSSGLGGLMGNQGGGIGGGIEDKVVDGEINQYVPQSMQGEADSFANKYV